MRWLFRLAFRGQYQQIQHMRAEIAWLRAQMEYERARSNHAVDQLLVWKANVNPITPPPVVAPVPGLDAMFSHPEMTMMGRPEGVA